METQTPRTYVLGHTDRELTRLEQQAAIFSDATADVLRRAGLRSGNNVLDVGCGVGDVSMIAAELVGITGRVLGIDRAAAPIEMATRRAESAGFHWLRFEQADLGSLPDGSMFDAITGRFILMHLADPGAALRTMLRRLRPGGTAVFIEMDITAAEAVPELPLFTRCMSWIHRLYDAVGVERKMGSRLYGAFRTAGLTPTMTGSTRVEAGPDAMAYDYVAESIRSIMPLLEQYGIASAQEVEIDTLAERLRQTAVAGDHCFVFPLLVGAWARKA